MTADIKQWLEDLSRLPDTDSAAWLPMHMAREDALLDEAGLRNALIAEGPLSGWHQETGGVMIYRNRPVAPQKLLSGEWFGETACIQTIYAGGNCWQWRRIRLQAGAASSANCLAQTIHHLRTNGKGRLRYFRLWQPDADGAPCVTASVLIDFDEA